MDNKNERWDKIRLIEEPVSDQLLKEELEEALAGWNCGSYGAGICSQWSDGICAGGTGENYCSLIQFG